MSASPELPVAAEKPAPLPVPKLAYSVPEAAHALGCSPVSIYRLIARGKLRAVRCLRHKLIPVTELTGFLARE